MRYLGIDYGTGKVGLALSDEAGSMGFPHGVVQNDSRLVAALLALIARENVGAVVIGESRTLAGGENPVAARARELGDSLAAAGITVLYEPEMLTTQEARRAPDGTRGAGEVDASAAALILTSYLSHA